MHVAVVIAALLVSAAGGWLVVMGVLRLASRSGDAGAPAADGPQGPQAIASLRGGTWIGILERLAVTMCVLVDESAGIAVVVAVKGLGRFPELRENPGASERFVIGTLASLVWSAAIGVGARALLT
ncbi:hypothetical protein [Cellulomonas rhizosphaerae]|uniref:Uncharacterized protein n=1 Tax=Cellulomonas rhizosphaerae TaxID=2293719 RepID=A0A413RK17_9CELL|nr:hypothetical protein [Cellulomonas rhizosphaerae]RHA39239.1 hypothetical protein D1825_12085 [Cellulomonas rhizosphaerae]